jgi:thiol-disulfide isomerase/thioredoxin
MKQLLALFTICILFASCNNNSEGAYTFSGTASGFEDGTRIYVYEVVGTTNTVTDTITVKSGKFSTILQLNEEPTLHFLKVGSINKNIIFFPGNSDLKANIYKDSINASFVTGTPQNDAYNEFNKKTLAFNTQKQNLSERFRTARKEGDNLMASQIQQENIDLNAEEALFKKKFVAEQNNSIFGVMLLSEMTNNKLLTPAEASELLNNLSPKVASSQIAKDLSAALEGIKNTEIGGQAPAFSAPDPDGNMLSLKETLGKYTIVDFWASWCKPCRIENPNVVRVYEKYHDKGLNIVSVSLDRQGQKERWLQAIEDDNMDWYHVSNLQFWQDPIARDYSVRAIPHTFLLDENGKIIDKNLRGRALENKIASLLGQ